MKTTQKIRGTKHNGLLFGALLLSASLLSLSFSHAQDIPSKRFTAERVFDLEYATSPQISPDGKHIVYVRHSMDIMKDLDKGSLWIIDTKSGEQRPLAPNFSANSASWSPDGSKILFTTSNNGQSEIRLMYVDSGNSFSLAQLPASPSNIAWSKDGSMIAFNMFVASKTPSFAKPMAPPEGAKWNPPVNVIDNLVFRFDGARYLKEGANQVFTLPVGGGTPRQVSFEETSLSNPEWLDPDTLLVTGNLAKDSDLDPIESEIYALKLSDFSIKALTTRDGPDNSPVVSPDGKMIAYTGFDDKVMSYQQSDLYLMKRNGEEQKILAEDFEGTFESISWTSDSKYILALTQDHGLLSLIKVSLSGKVSKLLTNIGGESIGRPYASGSYSVSAGRSAQIAYTKGFTSKPSEVAIATISGKKERILTDLNSDVLPYLDIAKVEEIKVKSSHDGLEIEAWVAFPPDFKADASYPMILEIHGGPHTMYGPTFSAEVQRFAAEGYVTVWSNPRGSTGYGEDFAQGIDLNYPGYDYNDLMSVVDEVIARKYVDPDRLFVTGGSGGGILTAWIVTKTNRFAAAASIKPVINWMTMALAGDIAQYVRRHWIRADPWSNPEAFLKLSPISYVDKIETPTLVMVGEEDYRTPAWEAEQFYTALKMNKVDTALIRVPLSPHYIASRPSRLIAKTDNIMGWFSMYDTKKGESE